MSDGRATFDRIDDDAFDDSRRLDSSVLRWSAVAVAYLLLFGGVAYGYRVRGADAIAVGGREIALLDWVTALSVLVLAVVVLPGVGRRPREAVAFLRSFVRDWIAALALACLLLLVGLAALGPTFTDRPEVTPLAIYQPPVGFSVADYVPVQCLGAVADGRCHGTLEHPFGTDEGGRDLFSSVVYGLQTSLQVGVSAAVITGGIGRRSGSSPGPSAVASTRSSCDTSTSRAPCRRSSRTCYSWRCCHRISC